MQKLELRIKHLATFVVCLADLGRYFVQAKLVDSASSGQIKLAHQGVNNAEMVFVDDVRSDAQRVEH